MTLLLGGGTIAGVLAMVAALLSIVYLARKGREDLLRLVATSHDLDAARLQKDRAEKAIEERDAAIQDLQNTLANERAAREAAQTHLSGILEELARSGDAAGAGERVRRSLGLLGQMSSVPGGPPTQDRGKADRVHGAATTGNRSASGSFNVPGPKRPEP